MAQVDQPRKKKQLLSSTELRLIAISLSVLSLGLAIAYLGFILLQTH